MRFYATAKINFCFIGIGFSKRGICAFVLPQKEEKKVIKDLKMLLGKDIIPANPPYKRRLVGDLKRYFEGKRVLFNYPLDLDSYTSFGKMVLRETLKIPYGETKTYKEIAIALGNPHYARAVGQALSKNHIPLIIPCHRVIGNNRELTGYTCGLSWKRRLLRIEGEII